VTKDEQIKHLEAEILAARETIKALTEVLKDVSKHNPNPVYYPPVYIQPYRYTGPYWSYTTGGVTYNSTVTDTTSATLSLGFQINPDDDEGDAGVRAAV
jgi:hypothetical protein